MEQIKRKWGIAVLMVALTALVMSCGSSHKSNGYHVSKIKEEELKAKSDFNLKQAKAIVNENEKNRPKNQRRAEKVRRKTNDAIVESQKEQSKAKIVRNNNSYKPKVVPSFY